MKRVVLNQQLSFAIKAQFGIPVLVFFIVLTLVDLYFTPFFIFAILFMFYSYDYEFNKDLKHRIIIKFFGIGLIGFNKSFINPEYISLFNHGFKSSLSFGFLEMGVSKHKEFTIKFFKEKQNEIVFRSNKKEEVLVYGQDLADLFNIELHNTLK